MSLEVAKNFFMWCSIINYGLLILWFVILVVARDGLKSLTETLLRRKLEHFDTMQFAGITFFKLGIILFNIVPWIAMTIILK